MYTVRLITQYKIRAPSYYNAALLIRKLLDVYKRQDNILVIRSGKSLISRYYYVANSFLILRCSSSEVDALHIRNMPQDSVERILDGIEMVRRGLKFPLCLFKLGG